MLLHSQILDWLSTASWVNMFQCEHVRTILLFIWMGPLPMRVHRWSKTKRLLTIVTTIDVRYATMYVRMLLVERKSSTLKSEFTLFSAVKLLPWALCYPGIHDRIQYIWIFHELRQNGTSCVSLKPFYLPTFFHKSSTLPVPECASLAYALEGYSCFATWKRLQKVLHYILNSRCDSWNSHQSLHMSHCSRGWMSCTSRWCDLCVFILFETLPHRSQTTRWSLSW